MADSVMHTTTAQAFELLRGWMTEEVIVGYGTIIPSVFKFTGYGFITKVTEDELVIGFDGRRGPPAPEGSLSLQLADAQYSYSDMRDCPVARRSEHDCTLVIKLRSGIPIYVSPLTPEANAPFRAAWAKGRADGRPR